MTPEDTSKDHTSERKKKLLNISRWRNTTQRCGGSEGWRAQKPGFITEGTDMEMGKSRMGR